MANLFPPPPMYDLPLTKGKDLIVDFRQRVDGVFTNYAAGTTVTLIIDTPTATTATAVIDTYHATCRLESTVTDLIKAGLLWRCRITLAGSPATDLVPCNGKTVRYDGK